MTKGINVYVPGILTFPGDSDNWSGKAVTYTHLNSERRAEKVEYFSTVFLRPFWQKRRARKLVKTLQYYVDKNWDIRLIGHSNGCDVILDALQDADWPDISQLHLVNAACEPDFRKNGLNAALHRGSIEQVFVYVAGKDDALRKAATFVGRWLGYGTLGLGPTNIDLENRERVTRRDWPTFGHSDCWAPGFFDVTVDSFIH